MASKRRSRPVVSSTGALTPDYAAPHQTAPIQDWQKHAQRMKRSPHCPRCRERNKLIAHLEQVIRHYRTLLRFKEHAAKLTVGVR